MKASNLFVRPDRPYSPVPERQELLPFRVRVAESPQDVQKAVESRAAAYARHMPIQAIALREPEDDDFRSDVLLLIAESKFDRRVVGSVRLQRNGERPLHIESQLALPASYRGRRLVEGRRLGVENGIPGRTVMVALVKAAYEMCHGSGIDYFVLAGRRPITAIYRSMLFDDTLEGSTIALPYAGNLPHSVFSMPIRDADRRWRESGHTLYDFMARTEHPDIAIDYQRVFATFGRA